ncbi:hypothetical protein BANRA_04620 [Escherichia coli]|nr:hypothetical protein BANRA_04620 [Escherichia coli]
MWYWTRRNRCRIHASVVGFGENTAGLPMMSWFAGWLTDVQVTGSGTSKTILTRYATVLNRGLPVPTQVASGQCRGELFALSAEENHSGKEYDGSKTRRT